MFIHIIYRVFSSSCLPETTEKKSYPRRHTKNDEGPPKVTALPHRHGLRPDKPARAPSRSNSVGRRPHPGARASRPHAIPLRVAQFPCDGAPGRPAGRNTMGSAQAESWPRCRSTWVEQMPRLCQTRCGRDARAPGWASSRDVVAAKEVYRSLVRLQQRSAVSSSNDPPGRAWRGLPEAQGLP